MKKKVKKHTQHIKKSGKKKAKKIVKKSSKKPVKKVIKKRPKKAVKRVVKKVLKKPVKHTKKHIKKNPVKKHLKKTVKKSSKKPLRKAIKRAVKGNPGGHVKKIPKNPVKRTANNPVKNQEEHVEEEATESHVEDESLKTIPADFFKKAMEEIPECPPKEEAGSQKYRTEYLKQFIGRSIKNYYKSLFSKTYELVRKKRDVFLKTIGLDFLFLIIMSVLLRGGMRFIPKDTPLEIYAIFGVPFVFTMMIVLFLIGIFLYSFIKYRILFVIESILEDVRFNLERFDKFFVLNCIIIGLGAVFFLAAYGIIYFFDSRIKAAIWVAFALICALIYSFTNISHWLFAHEPKFRKTMKRSLIIMTGGFERYIGITGLMIGVLAAYLLIIVGIGWVLKIAGAGIGAYKSIAVGVGVIIFYITLAYNRVCFYFAVEKLKNEIKY
ncbi:hypothetical protein KY360_03310 [Candidatus Woesearchaeota archaeon]|nr:hypothetical protein [Candidatus Woesearchaeota archaeon]